jgi:hypothetical protein
MPKDITPSAYMSGSLIFIFFAFMGELIPVLVHLLVPDKRDRHYLAKEALPWSSMLIWLLLASCRSAKWFRTEFFYLRICQAVLVERHVNVIRNGEHQRLHWICLSCEGNFLYAIPWLRFLALAAFLANYEFGLSGNPHGCDQ